MIQLRMLRPISDGKLNDEFAKLTAPSHTELLKNLQSYIEKIPEGERYNIFYTLGHVDPSEGEQKRTWSSQESLPFDIDDVDASQIPQLLQVFFEVTGLDKNKTAVVSSGHGLQILVALATPIVSREYFKANRKSYKAILDNLSSAMSAKGLKGKPDPAVFAPNFLFRLPGTINRKAHKGLADCNATLLQGHLEPQEFMLSVAGLTDSDQITEKQMSYMAVDTPSVEAGCNFLKWAKEKPAEVNEPQWYASLSILGRLDNGRQKALDYSKGHPQYSAEGTLAKLDQALATSGPRTCENINALWSGCEGCPNFRKVSSPITIKSKDFIATSATGFHLLNAKGGLSPQHEDLRRFFDRELGYFVHPDSGGIYVHNEKLYEHWSKLQLKAYAGEMFKPDVMDHVAVEFVARVQRTKHERLNADSTEGLINFSNGILEIKSGKLIPHHRDYHFLYVLPFDYDPNAKCKEFDALMDRVSCSDLDITQQLLEFTGYSICDQSYRWQKALLLKGSGANGKSTFLRIVEKIAGEKNVSCLSLTDLQNEVSRSMLEGRLLNISDEMPSYKMANSELFKKLMGGKITIRTFYEMGTEMECRTKFMFGCNEIPSTWDNSEGLYRRFMIVPFDAKFDKSNTDHALMQKIDTELPGIFNRVYSAYRAALARGYLHEASRSIAELKSYQRDNDFMGTWIDETLKVEAIDATSFVATTELLNKYNAEHKTEMLGSQPFTKALKRKIPHYEERRSKKWINKSYIHVLTGISFRRGIDAEEEPKVNGAVHANGNGHAKVEEVSRVVKVEPGAEDFL